MKIALCLAAVLLSGSLFAQTGSIGADETRIIALENAWNLAQVQHDDKALDGLVPATFVYTDYDGTVMNKQQFLHDLKDPDYVASLVANDEIKVHVYGTMAIVTGRYHTKGTYKRKPFEHWGRFTDTWVYQQSQWQCVASHTNLISK